MPKGLVNIGNTCSINTVIQCIGHCPTIRNFILTPDIPFIKLKNRNYSIYEELKDVFSHLWINNNNIIPRRFIKAFYESIGNTYSLGEQLDFTEMWMLLLNNIIEETHKLEYLSIHQKMVEYKEDILNHLQTKVNTSWIAFSKASNSPLNDILYGTQIQQITCKSCGKVYHNIDQIAFHYIEIIHGPSMINGIEKLLSEETMHGWKCDKCSHQNASKILRFWRLPKIWMIVLQRFNNMSKIINPIDILETIILDKSVEISTASTITYSLCAIANHYGSLNGGHYTAICKNTNNEWYDCDDMQITKIDNIKDILLKNRSAYALFYERL
jgi:ubiquitin carboxyl-terminal hydrolase 8